MVSLLPAHGLSSSNNTLNVSLGISEYVERYPEMLLLLALAYPWRVQWLETERYVVPTTSPKRR
jgi:predicted RNA-binding protein Jag